MMKHILRLVMISLTLAYPFLVYWGIQAEQHGVMLIVLTVLLMLRFVMVETKNERWFLGATFLILALFMLYLGSESGLKLYPVMVNLGFLFLFASSLFVGRPVIERLARIKEPELPIAAVQYTRRVTQAWCVFFIVNASISLWTVLLANEEVWLLYNGVIAYLLMGTMFVGEWIIRQRVRGEVNE
jgi:uncharacterized membrane protein